MAIRNKTLMLLGVLFVVTLIVSSEMVQALEERQLGEHELVERGLIEELGEISDSHGKPSFKYYNCKHPYYCCGKKYYYGKYYCTKCCYKK